MKKKRGIEEREHLQAKDLDALQRKLGFIVSEALGLLSREKYVLVVNDLIPSNAVNILWCNQGCSPWDKLRNLVRNFNQTTPTAKKEKKKKQTINASRKLYSPKITRVLDLDTSKTLISSSFWFFNTMLGSASPTSRTLESEEEPAEFFVTDLAVGLEAAVLAFFAAGATLGGAGFSASRLATRADLLGTKVASVIIVQNLGRAIEDVSGYGFFLFVKWW